jgi:hypothetical protein
MKAWIAEQPTLSKEMAAADARLKEAETRHLQELDRVCALSSPRVAFERRLMELTRYNHWNIWLGMINGEQFDNEESHTEYFRYLVRYFDRGHCVEYWEEAFLSKDHGNYVDCDRNLHEGTTVIYLYILPFDPESLTVDELKKVLKRRGLPDSGEKVDLVARVQELKERVV